ncbi:MAG TPA: pyrrolo-quinoline quinone [Verrucomicrobia bacterium]|nr:pyrrolo-quinoline quinone [Verrucomicrobiota bacterium]
MNIRITIVGVVSITLLAMNSFAGDWPAWGRDASRNFYSPAKGIVNEFTPGDYKRGTEEIDMSTTENVLWAVKLGSQAYGNPTVANGRVFIGTNNESLRIPKFQGDYSTVYCLDEKSGEFLWQLSVPKLGAGKVSDWEYLGICSSPSVDGDRVYVVSSRCEILCLDVYGMENGNQGYADEAKYMAGPGNPPVKVGEKDADIIWKFDMRSELGVFPHNVTSSSVLITKDKIFATTSNGQDWSHKNIPAPLAPCLIALDKKTGKLVGEEVSGISERIMHCNWSSPGLAIIDGREQVVFGAGDGFTYGFDTTPVKSNEDDFMVLKELWKADCIPHGYRFKDGKPIKYMVPEGPSEIIATPVFYKGKVYVGLGQDPEHGEGNGNLVCIDVSKTGDITQTGIIWSFKGLNRTISTVSIDPETDLLFIADYSGFVYCVDANTGEEYWQYDTKAHIWGSTLVVDGKVIIGDEDGDLVMLPAKKDFDPKKDEPIFETFMPSPIYSTPVVANGVLYVATQTHLYAVKKK